MGSRNREQTTAHQPLLSSLVVRLTDNERTADFEPGEVNRDPPSYSRSARFYEDSPGYAVHAGSVSPVRRRNEDRHFHSAFDHSGAMPHRGRGRGRDSGRYRESSPRFSRGMGVDRSWGRGSGGHRLRPGPFKADTAGKSNPNVEPREGDWYCSEPACNNLNFARRDHCNNCHRPRRGTELSPRRGHPGPPPPLRRFSGMDQSPRRATNGYRSPPQMGRNYGVDLLLERDRRVDRFADRHIRRDQPGYLDDGFDGRGRFDRRDPPMGYAAHREHIRDSLYNDRKGYERRLPSPPLPSLHPPPPVAPGRWARDRSRSPILLRDELPLKDYRRGSYLEHVRNERRDPLALSTLPQSPRAASGRWARDRSQSPLRNERRDPLPLTTLPQSPRVSSGRWARERSLSPLRNELPHRGEGAYMNRGRDDGMARGERDDMRGMARGERDDMRGMARGERDDMRGLARGERDDMHGLARGERDDMRGIARGERDAY
ncbi:unnamed protein product [Rhodiola kirilowii]